MFACAIVILMLGRPPVVPASLRPADDQSQTVQHTNEVLRALTQQAQEDFQNGRYQPARDQLQQALRIVPDDPNLWKYLGLVDAQLNDLEAAIGDFRKVLSILPEDVPSLVNLGRLYQRKGDNTRAMEMYRRSLAVSPDDASANQNYAVLLTDAGRFHEAIVPLRKLKTLNSSDLPTRASLIECYLKSKMLEEGEREIQEYLMAPNASPEDKLKLAKLLMEDKLPDSAQIVLSGLVQQAPDSAVAHAAQGIGLLNRSQYEDATKELRLAVQLDPQSAEYSMALVDALISGKHFQEALQFLVSTQNLFGGLFEFRFKMGVILYGARHYHEAISVFEKLDYEKPNLDLTQYYLGNSHGENGELDVAQAYYRKAIALNPNQALYYSALAKVLRKEGDDKTDAAISNLHKALRLDPSDAATKQELAICYERKRDYAKAERLLQEVVSQTPDVMPAHVALARIYYQDHKKDLGDAEKKIILRLEAQQQADRSP